MCESICSTRGDGHTDPQEFVLAESQRPELGVILQSYHQALERDDSDHLHSHRGPSIGPTPEWALTIGELEFQAEAIANYSHLFRRSEGLYLTFAHQGTMEGDFLEQAKDRDIHLVVCSDAEAILGIGDQGVGVV